MGDSTERASGEVLDFRPGADMTWRIVRAEPAFETINWVAPGTGDPPVHLHPRAEESYEVLEGSIEVLVGGKWRKLGPGEKVIVPPGAPHAVRADGESEARLINVHSPALNFESFFRHFHHLVSSGAVKLPPKDPRSLLYMSVLFSAFPDEQRVVRPPQAFFSALGFLGRRLGYRLDADRWGGRSERLA